MWCFSCKMFVFISCKDVGSFAWRHSRCHSAQRAILLEGKIVSSNSKFYMCDIQYILKTSVSRRNV
jgi:hypothetical protein